jgi:flagellar hook assembly protein FlgD
VQPLIHGTPLTLTPAQAGLNTFTIDVSNGITDVAKERIISSNYPNPFNPTTTISYTLPDNITDSHVTIYNVRGQKVITLDATAAASGLHQATWHGDDSSGKPVASGVYFYRIQANDIEVTRRMLLLK